MMLLQIQAGSLRVCQAHLPHWRHAVLLHSFAVRVRKGQGLMAVTEAKRYDAGHAVTQNASSSSVQIMLVTDVKLTHHAQLPIRQGNGHSNAGNDMQPTGCSCTVTCNACTTGERSMLQVWIGLQNRVSCTCWLLEGSSRGFLAAGPAEAESSPPPADPPATYAFVADE